MAHSTRTIPLVVASVTAVVLVAGAYVLSGPIPFIDRVTAESSDELLRSYAVKDSDADGLTDWQESLYGTDPLNPTSFRADLLDGEAARQELLTPKTIVPTQDLTTDLPGVDPAPSSLTEEFSRAFLGQYLLTRGTEPPTQEEMATFVSDAVAELVQTSLASPRYSAADVRIATGDDATAFRTYMKEAQAVSDKFEPLLEDRDVALIRSAIEKSDTEALKKLAGISKTYSDFAETFMEIRVPKSAVEAHVAIANAAWYLSAATGNVAGYTSDPIRTLLGIGEYRESIRLTLEAFASMHAPMQRSMVRIDESAPEYDFYRTVQAAPDALKIYRAAYPTP